MKTFTILGTCDNVTTCECCGRSDLKRTVALDDGHGTTYYGTTCAARATKRSAGFVARKARVRVLECEECAGCRADVHLVGSLGRVLCPGCVAAHRAALLEGVL